MPKRIMPLSDIQAKTAKPQANEYKLSDGGGLYLLITPTGGKLWNMKYRFGGKEKRLSFGAYPVLTLADARQRREDAKKLLANGVDPGEMKKILKTANSDTSTNTFEIVAREWHHKFASAGKWSESHAVTSSVCIGPHNWLVDAELLGWVTQPTATSAPFRFTPLNWVRLVRRAPSLLMVRVLRFACLALLRRA